MTTATDDIYPKYNRLIFIINYDTTYDLGHVFTTTKYFQLKNSMR